MNILFEVKNHVANVTINRPNQLNAIDDETEKELNDIWLRIERDNSIRCVVLTGAGDRAFSAGYDVKQPNKDGLEYWSEHRPNGFGGIALRRTLDVPVIGRVNGLAIGGGFEMVLGCDIVVAATNAEFSLPEARIGRLPITGGMAQLQRKIPHNLAMGILLSGRRFSADELLGYGLFNEVVEFEQLDSAVDVWVQNILASAPLSLRAIKQAVNQTAHLSAHDAMAIKLPAVVTALKSEDSQEGVTAFSEKRTPRWQGR